MARKSPKCPPAVELNQFGCVWNFGGMFDHHHRHHGGQHQKLLSDEFRRSKSLPGAGQDRSQVRMLTFDEQLRIINIQSKKKTSSVNRSLKKTIEKSFWKKIKSRYENTNKKKEKTKTIDRIVVLKPIERVVECPVDITCQCLHLHPHQRSSCTQHIVKHTHVLFNDLRKKVKNSKNLKSYRKKKTHCETNENGSRTVNLSLVPYSMPQEPEVFMEARRHLAERLRLVAMGAGLGARVNDPLGFSCKKVSRTLEKVLLLSPLHERMAGFGSEPEGTHGDSMFSNTGSGPNNMSPSPSRTKACIKGPQMELLLDVSSPKNGCRENPSPVSVLDSFFSDIISSPTSSSTIESVEHQIQPRRLDFEESSSQTSSPQRETNLSILTEDREFISSYVNEMYQTAQSNWVDFIETDLLCDHQVLHDYVKDLLVSLHSRITLSSSWVRPFSLEKDVINKVVDQVDWHNGQPMGPRTLDHLVRRDMEKCEPWLDTILDRNDIVVEVADETLQELVIEAVYEIYFLKLS